MASPEDPSRSVNGCSGRRASSRLPGRRPIARGTIGLAKPEDDGSGDVGEGRPLGRPTGEPATDAAPALRAAALRPGKQGEGAGFGDGCGNSTPSQLVRVFVQQADRPSGRAPLSQTAFPGERRMRETRDRVAGDRARWSPLETLGRMTLAERRRAGTVPLSPAPSGERAEAGVLAGRGRGAAACSQANAVLTIGREPHFL